MRHGSRVLRTVVDIQPRHVSRKLGRGWLVPSEGAYFATFDVRLDCGHTVNRWWDRMRAVLALWYGASIRQGFRMKCRICSTEKDREKRSAHGKECQ